MNKFSERLKQVLEDKNISQVALANQIEMSRTIVNNYCTGKREPSLDALILISKALDESVDYLLGLEN